jgi:hypothetical protein
MSRGCLSAAGNKVPRTTRGGTSISLLEPLKPVVGVERLLLDGLGGGRLGRSHYNNQLVRNSWQKSKASHMSIRQQ